MASGAMVWFSCCVTQRPAKRRPRIDRSMIGLPTEFRHTGHIGSGDVSNETEHLSSLQTQMSSKGGYDHISTVDVQMNLSDVQKT